MKNRKKFYINGFMLTVVALSLKTVALFWGAYVTRVIGAEGVGLNALTMTVYSFAVTLATSGIGLTVTRLVAQEIGKSGGGEARVLRGAFFYALLFGSFSSVMLFLLSGPIGRGVLGNRECVTALRILSLSLLPAAATSVIGGYFIGVRRVPANAAVQVLGQTFRIIITVYLISGVDKGNPGAAVVSLSLGSTLTELICFCFCFFLFCIDRYRERHSKSAHGRELRGVFGMALPLAASAYIRSALLSVEHSLIPKRLRDRGEKQAEAMASYGRLHGMALPVILYPLSPLSSFAGLLVPEFAEEKERGGKDRMSGIATRAIGTTLSYAVMITALIFFFSEELGYVIYDSYEAGFFIATLAPVIPIMYLDHVCDSILKGIGEHVYSMWVNILDSFLSVILVYLIIPVFGISGYALVIIGMEIFNFILSVKRLKKRIPYKISVFSMILVPIASAFVSVTLTKLLFFSSPSSEGAVFLIMKIVFMVCAYLAAYITLRYFYLSSAGKTKREKTA